MHYTIISSYDILDEVIELDKITNDNHFHEIVELNKTEECIICLEPIICNENLHLLSSIINKHDFLIKYCNCDCNVHEECVNNWLSKNVICIICREPFDFNNEDENSEHSDENEIDIETMNDAINNIDVYVNINSLYRLMRRPPNIKFVLFIYVIMYLIFYKTFLIFIFLLHILLCILFR